MRIEDVKVGDVVIPKEWSFDHFSVGQMLPSERIFCDKPTIVLDIDMDDNTIWVASEKCQRVHDTSYGSWWPIEYCDLALTPNTPPIDARVSVSRPDQSNATRLLIELHDREKSDLRRRLDNAVKEAEAAERALTTARSEAATDAKVLRSQIAALEKQVADLKSERDRVGKTSQTGTRFAQLELD
jgi:hypothetical protein